MPDTHHPHRTRIQTTQNVHKKTALFVKEKQREFVNKSQISIFFSIRLRYYRTNECVFVTCKLDFKRRKKQQAADPNIRTTVLQSLHCIPFPFQHNFMLFLESDFVPILVITFLNVQIQYNIANTMTKLQWFVLRCFPKSAVLFLLRIIFIVCNFICKSTTQQVCVL